MKLEGVYPALVTPFKDSASGAEIDWESWERMVDWQLESGVQGLVIFGTTGESATLSRSEKLELSRRTLKQVNSRVPVIAGTGSNNTKDSLLLTQEVAEIGIDAALVVAPYYNKPSQAGLEAHFRMLADQGGIPLVLYNVPSRTVVSISVETFSRLSKHPNIIACKQAVDSISELVELSAEIDPSMSILAGDDALLYSVLCCGGTGVISATAAAFPKEMLEVWTQYQKGDLKASLRAQQDLLPTISAMFIETNPAPAKAALKIKGIIAQETLRLPMLPVADGTREQLRKIIER